MPLGFPSSKPDLHGSVTGDQDTKQQDINQLQPLPASAILLASAGANASPCCVCRVSGTDPALVRGNNEDANLTAGTTRYVCNCQSKKS